MFAALKKHLESDVVPVIVADPMDLAVPLLGNVTKIA